jgi:phospholipase C
MFNSRLNFPRVAFGLAIALLSACANGPGPVLTPQPLPSALTAPPIKHVFTIILENQAYDNTFGVEMPVPYLTKTVAAQGASIRNYYGTSRSIPVPACS